MGVGEKAVTAVVSWRFGKVKTGDAIVTVPTIPASKYLSSDLQLVKMLS